MSRAPSRSAANCAEVDNRRGTTRVRGAVTANFASAPGNTSGASSNGTPIRMMPASSAVKAVIVRTAWSRRAKIARASPSSVIPASVGSTPVLRRVSSVTPSSRSSALIVCDSAGWLTCSRRAAADIPPSSTTTTKAVNSRNSMATLAEPHRKPLAQLIADV